MISDKQVDKFLNKALGKMFQCVGLKYSEKFTKQSDWYLLHACALQGELGHDWVVCTNIKSARFGKLTFEHQAGVGCYEPNEEIQALNS